MVPEFANIILVISDSNFPYVSEPVKEMELEKKKKKKNKHEVLSCHCGVLGKHVIFFCEITTDNGQITRFNLIICPTAQQNFIKSLQCLAMQQQKPLQIVLMGKH